MKKIVKLFIIFGVVIILSGCGNKEFLEYYKNMSIDSKSITGYQIDLRISGSNKKAVINKTIKIDNYMNTDYKISEKNVLRNIFELFKNKKFGFINNTDEVIYVVNNKVYEDNDKNEIVLSDRKLSSIHFRNPDIYLEGLKNIKKVEKTSNVTINTKKYKLYKVIISKKITNDLAKEVNIAGISNKKDFNAEIYINSENYVHRIIYKIDGITFNILFYGINNTRSINVSK